MSGAPGSEMTLCKAVQRVRAAHSTVSVFGNVVLSRGYSELLKRTPCVLKSSTGVSLAGERPEQTDLVDSEVFCEQE